MNFTVDVDARPNDAMSAPTGHNGGSSRVSVRSDFDFVKRSHRVAVRGQVYDVRMHIAYMIYAAQDYPKAPKKVDNDIKSLVMGWMGVVVAWYEVYRAISHALGLRASDNFYQVYANSDTAAGRLVRRVVDGKLETQQEYEARVGGAQNIYEQARVYTVNDIATTNDVNLVKTALGLPDIDDDEVNRVQSMLKLAISAPEDPDVITLMDVIDYYKRQVNSGEIESGDTDEIKNIDMITTFVDSKVLASAKADSDLDEVTRTVIGAVRTGVTIDMTMSAEKNLACIAEHQEAKRTKAVASLAQTVNTASEIPDDYVGMLLMGAGRVLVHSSVAKAVAGIDGVVAALAIAGLAEGGDKGRYVSVFAEAAAKEADKMLKLVIADVVDRLVKIADDATAEKSNYAKLAADAAKDLAGMGIQLRGITGMINENIRNSEDPNMVMYSAATTTISEDPDTIIQRAGVSASKDDAAGSMGSANELHGLLSSGFWAFRSSDLVPLSEQIEIAVNHPHLLAAADKLWSMRNTADFQKAMISPKLVISYLPVHVLTAPYKHSFITADVRNPSTATGRAMSAMGSMQAVGAENAARDDLGHDSWHFLQPACTYWVGMILLGKARLALPRGYVTADGILVQSISHTVDMCFELEDAAKDRIPGSIEGTSAVRLGLDAITMMVNDLSAKSKGINKSAAAVTVAVYKRALDNPGITRPQLLRMKDALMGIIAFSYGYSITSPSINNIFRDNPSIDNFANRSKAYLAMGRSLGSYFADRAIDSEEVARTAHTIMASMFHVTLDIAGSMPRIMTMSAEDSGELADALAEPIDNVNVKPSAKEIEAAADAESAKYKSQVLAMMVDKAKRDDDMLRALSSKYITSAI